MIFFGNYENYEYAQSTYISKLLINFTSQSNLYGANPLYITQIVNYKRAELISS